MGVGGGEGRASEVFLHLWFVPSALRHERLIIQLRFSERGL